MTCTTLGLAVWAERVVGLVVPFGSFPGFGSRRCTVSALVSTGGVEIGGLGVVGVGGGFACTVVNCRLSPVPGARVLGEY